VSVPLGTETLDVVVVGDVMVDVLAAMSGPLARGSDTPSAVTTAGGGSAANVAVWLAAQGVPTSYVGRVGDDALGRESVAALTDRGVTAWVSIEADLTTGTCIVLVEPGGERSMLPDAGANATLTAADLPQRAFRPGGHLHLSGSTLLNPGSRDAGLAALSMAAAADMTVSVDPSSAAPLAELGAARFLSMTRGVDLLLANRDEAAVLAGTSDPHLAAQQLGDTYREVVVKLGADGALWHRGFISASAPAERGVDVVDTTGAGDTFCGALGARLALGDPLDAALRWAAAAAALSTTRPGAVPSVPHADEVEAMLTSAA
jgi:sugar/nucleoside kinase (ribokinase family)